MAQYSKRGRSSNRRRQGGSNNPNRSMDSQGPDVKIRGTAAQIHEKYQALARDAASSGDRIRAESLMQHAEHYYRLMKSMQPDKPAEQKKDDAEARAAEGNDKAADKKDQASPASAGSDGGAENDTDKSSASGNGSSEADTADTDEKADARSRRRRRRRRPAESESGSDDQSGEKSESGLAFEEAAAE